jgi:hypothetical protein
MLELSADLGLRWPSFDCRSANPCVERSETPGSVTREVCCCYGLMLLMEGPQASVSTGTGLEPSVGPSWPNVPAPGWVLGLLSPVLKHGPRSLPDVQVKRCQTARRNESDSTITGSTCVQWSSVLIVCEKDLKLSTPARTRKIANFSWAEGSQGKPWWTFESMLTCKSLVRSR